MTQIPQIARFARDRQVADRFANLAEFSIRLLQWKATERPPVIKTQRWLKSEIYKQTPLGGGAKTPTLAEAIRMAGDGYWSLESPHLVKIEVGEDIEVIEIPRELRLIGGKPFPLPVVLRNGGASPLTATLKTASRKGSGTHSFRLLPGEAAGTYMTLHTEAGSEAMPSLEVRAQDRTKPIPLEGSVVSAGRLTVRVLDEEGLVTPARIYLTGSDGRAYRPAEALARVSNADYGQPFGGDYYFYSGGDFQVDLPPGDATLEVVKGFRIPAGLPDGLHRARSIRHDGNPAAKAVRPAPAGLVLRRYPRSPQRLRRSSHPARRRPSHRQGRRPQPPPVAEQQRRFLPYQRPAVFPGAAPSSLRGALPSSTGTRR